MKDTTTVFDLTTDSKEELLEYLKEEYSRQKGLGKSDDTNLDILPSEMSYFIKLIINDLEATK